MSETLRDKREAFRQKYEKAMGDKLSEQIASELCALARMHADDDLVTERSAHILRAALSQPDAKEAECERLREAVRNAENRGREQGLTEAYITHEIVNPASDEERLNGDPGAGAMSAVLEYRDKIKALIPSRCAEGQARPGEYLTFSLGQVATRMQFRLDAMEERDLESIGISKGFAQDIVRACTDARAALKEDKP